MKLHEANPALRHRILEQVRRDDARAAELRRDRHDHAAGLSAGKVTQPEQRPALVNVAPGKGAGAKSSGDGARYHITFTCYAVRPRDFDNLCASVKGLLDCIVEAGYLPDDNWRVLSGSVESKKAAHRSDEKTVVTIECVK